MSRTTDERVRWTNADLELLPDNGTRYEIIDGELFMTRVPHWEHQNVCINIGTELKNWSRESGLGRVAIALRAAPKAIAPGIIFTEADNVIPDLVWASNERLANLLDDAGHLTGAPELIVEVLSPGADNERRDREVKLKLYSARRVHEYWVVDWRLQKVEIYRREKAKLILVATLLERDEITSPFLPGFSCSISRFFN